MDIGSWELRNFALRIVAWAVMGAQRCRSPSLTWAWRAALALERGGLSDVPAYREARVVGRIVGIAYRRASHWASPYISWRTCLTRPASKSSTYETSRVGLGPIPVFIGAARHIFKKGLPPRCAELLEWPLSNTSRPPTVSERPRTGSRLSDRPRTWLFMRYRAQVVHRPTSHRILDCCRCSHCAARDDANRPRSHPSDRCRRAGKITTLSNPGDSATFDSPSR